MMNLQPFDLPLDRIARCQKRGHDDHRAQGRRHAAGKPEARQCDCVKSIHGAAIHQRHGRIRRRDQREERKDAERPTAVPLHIPAQQQRGDDGGGEHEDPEIAGNPNGRDGANQPSADRRMKSKRPLEGFPSFRDEVVAGLLLASRDRIALRRVCGTLGRQQRKSRDLDLRVIRASRQFFDRAPIEIPGREIECGKIAPARRLSSTRLMLSNSSRQSIADIRRMLVMTLRIVTFTAPWRCCSAWTMSSAVVPWAARRSSSQRSAGITFGS